MSQRIITVLLVGGALLWFALALMGFMERFL